MNGETSSGFILLSTLSMSVILALLLLAHMQQILVYTKALGMQTLQEKRFSQLEVKAKELMRGNHKACSEISDDANSILKQLPKRGCVQEGEERYYYLFEDLGQFPCSLNKKTGLGFHRRLSLMQIRKNADNMYMQWRIISGDCDFTGISSWRYGML